MSHQSPTTSPSRRARSRARLAQVVLDLTAAGSILAAVATVAPATLAQSFPPRGGTGNPPPTLPLTPSFVDSDAPTSAADGLTPAQTEGPYFKPNSPERTSLVQDGLQGTLLTITGQVLSPDGQPVAGALVDFWQADAGGQYDNRGYDLRGHQYTDENGTYTLTTVVPGLYPGRTRHIHVKVQAPNGPILTTQLYFPDEARNATDGIFNPALVLPMQAGDDGSQTALFNFVVATA